MDYTMEDYVLWLINEKIKFLYKCETKPKKSNTCHIDT